MSKKMIELNLPEFAFVEGYRDDDELKDRNVILHIRSASVMEIFEQEDTFPVEGIITMPFKRFNHLVESMTGEECEERYVMLLHHSPLFDEQNDRDYIIKNIMKPASMWYCDYCTYMDNMVNREDLI